MSRTTRRPRLAVAGTIVVSLILAGCGGSTGSVASASAVASAAGIPSVAASPAPTASASTTPAATVAPSPPPSAAAASATPVQAAVAALNIVDKGITAAYGPTGLNVDDQSQLFMLEDDVTAALDSGNLTAARTAFDAFVAAVDSRAAKLKTTGGARLLAAIAAMDALLPR